MPRRVVAVVLVILVLLLLFVGLALEQVARQPGQGFALTANMGMGARFDLIVSRCTRWQSGRLLLLRTDVNRHNRLTDTVTTVLIGSRIAPPCP